MEAEKVAEFIFFRHEHGDTTMKRKAVPTLKLMALLILTVQLSLCIACDTQNSFVEVQNDTFALVTGFKDQSTTRTTINDDPKDSLVEHVYVKVFNDSGNYLQVQEPIVGIPGATEMTYSDGKWSATVKLSSPASGKITFVIWAESSTLGHLYSGSTQITIDPAYQNTGAIVIPTKSGYSVGDIGPAGGYIFYDKGAYTPYYYDYYPSEKWRYLEASPKDISNNFSWGAVGDYLANTVSDIGGGVHNTDVIVLKYPYSYHAAHACKDFEANGFDDFFLPSEEEMNKLILFYTSKYPENPLGLQRNFGTANYHTSTEISSGTNWVGLFRENSETKEMAYLTEHNKSSAYIRPVRRF